ncbi:ATP-dependent DNA helicase [Methanobacterium sp. YSL]|nr:ATP-dependent DNA helicase [Methanobacterium sp. YSL]
MPLKCPECKETLKKGLIICPECGRRGVFVKDNNIDTYSALLENFPSWMTPRPQQETILQKIAQGLDDGYHYILLDAGTGIGKSAIAVTLANYFSSAYLVTITKQLQDQYHNDFKFQVLKGRNNFDCMEGMVFKDTTCDDGLCQTADLVCDHGISSKGELLCFSDMRGQPFYYNSDDPCHYWLQKGRSVRSPITLMNYSSFFPEMNYMDHFGERVLAVFDEVHNMENQVMDQLSLELSNKILKKDFEEYLEKLREIDELDTIPQLSEEAFTEDVDFWKKHISKYNDAYKSILKVSDVPLKKRKSVHRAINRLSMVESELEDHPTEWVIEANQKAKSVTFKPVEVSRFVQRYLLGHTDYCLLMSATILSKEHFCKWHGINPDDALYIQVKSPFKIENRPIYLETTGRMSSKYIDQSKPRSIPILKKILDKHPDDKGLIHTHSHKLATYISENIQDPRVIIYSPQPNSRRAPKREVVIRKFVESEEPLVLVAPSVDEGVDFPDDLCRFQVIYKMPFPYLGDKQIMTRMKRDGYWYAYKTVASLVQAYGRGMRNEDDYCNTYILDQDIYGVLRERWRKCLYFIPEYFEEAIF